jgi:hypothetical protein
MNHFRCFEEETFNVSNYKDLSHEVMKKFLDQFSLDQIDEL